MGLLRVVNGVNAVVDLHANAVTCRLFNARQPLSLATDMSHNGTRSVFTVVGALFFAFTRMSLLAITWRHTQEQKQAPDVLSISYLSKNSSEWHSQFLPRPIKRG